MFEIECLFNDVCYMVKYLVILCACAEESRECTNDRLFSVIPVKIVIFWTFQRLSLFLSHTHDPRITLIQWPRSDGFRAAHKSSSWREGVIVGLPNGRRAKRRDAGTRVCAVLFCNICCSGNYAVVCYFTATQKEMRHNKTCLKLF